MKGRLLNETSTNGDSSFYTHAYTHTHTPYFKLISKKLNYNY